MNLIRWNPMSEMVSLRDAMDRLFEHSVVGPKYFTYYTNGSHFLPLDMYENDEAVVIKASVPGMRPEDFDVTFEDGTVTIKGETKSEEESKDENYICRERRYGSFYRQVTLPTSVAADKAEATFENGVLTLTMPKAEEVKPRQIKVKATATIEAPKNETEKK